MDSELAEHERRFEELYARDLERAQETDSRLGIQHFLMLKNEEAISLKRNELRSLQGEEVDTEKFDAQAEGKGLVEVAEERKAVARKLQKDSTKKDAYRKKLTELELVEMLLRQRKLRRKTESLSTELAKLFSPVNKSVRELMGLETSRFSRLKKTALDALRENLESAKSEGVSGAH